MAGGDGINGDGKNRAGGVGPQLDGVTVGGEGHCGRQGFAGGVKNAQFAKIDHPHPVPGEEFNGAAVRRHARLKIAAQPNLKGDLPVSGNFPFQGETLLKARLAVHIPFNQPVAPV